MKTIVIALIVLNLCSINVLLGQKKTYTCINENGEVVFNFESHYVWPFSDGMACFKTSITENNKAVWRAGFIDDKGNVVIPAIYDSRSVSCYKFKDGVSWVKEPGNEKFVLINKNGKIISEKSYEKVGYFKDSVCAVYEGSNMGFINASGKEIIPCKYIGDPCFHSGLVCLRSSNTAEEKYGFFNNQGEQIIPFKFVQGAYCEFENGECCVKMNDKNILINTKGEIVFTPSLTNNSSTFSDGLALAYTNPDRTGFGYYNRNNEWVIQPIYTSAKSFENGLAIVEMNGKFGVINTLGKEVIPIKFDNIFGNCSDQGLFSCVLNNLTYFYNSQGKYFTNVEVKQVCGKNGGKLYPFKNMLGKMGFMNADGTVHIDAQYDNVEAFYEGKAWVY